MDQEKIKSAANSLYSASATNFMTYLSSCFDRWVWSCWGLWTAFPHLPLLALSLCLASFLHPSLTLRMKLCPWAHLYTHHLMLFLSLSVSMIPSVNKIFSQSIFDHLDNNVSEWARGELASGFSSIFTSGWPLASFWPSASWSSSSFSSCLFTSILMSSWLGGRVSPEVSWELGWVLLLTEVGEETWPSAVREGFGDSCSTKMDR